MPTHFGVCSLALVNISVWGHAFATLVHLAV
jgi:hypothetical protein